MADLISLGIAIAMIVFLTAMLAPFVKAIIDIFKDKP